jgi:hypothetical protein
MQANSVFDFGIVEKGRILIAIALTWTAVGCASTRKTVPELSMLEGKRIALIEIEGEPTARQIVEVALVNQLAKRGTFILVSQKDVEHARAKTLFDPRDDRKVAEAVQASHTLRAKVLNLDADETKGFGKSVVYDSQLAEERGGDGKSERVFPIKALDGNVRVELRFLEIQTGEERKAVAEASRRLEKDAQKEAIHLPPKMRFLEELANEAFQDFFERYN